jgi:hypothetical protein
MTVHQVAEVFAAFGILVWLGSIVHDRVIDWRKKRN